MLAEKKEEEEEQAIAKRYVFHANAINLLHQFTGSLHLVAFSEILKVSYKTCRYAG